MAIHFSSKTLLPASVLAAAGLFSAVAPWHAYAVNYRTVVLTGDAAAGLEPGVVYSSLNSIVINSSGDIGFHGNLSGSGVDATNDSGIWYQTGGTMNLVARTGDTATGLSPGVVYSNFSTIFVLNNAGETAFSAKLSGTGVTGTNDRGIWLQSSGTLDVVVRSGDAAPGTNAGVVYSSTLGSPVLNNAGEIAFWGRVVGTGVVLTNNTGIWSTTGGTLSLVARTGDAASDTGPGVVYSYLIGPTFNSAGDTAFLGGLFGTGVDLTNDDAIFLQSSGTLELVAREGAPAAGTGPGVVYRDLNPPKLNGVGDIAFFSRLSGTGVNTTNVFGIWSQSGGTQKLVARSGDAAPGTGPSVVFSSFSQPIINNAGDTAFVGDLTGTGVNATNENGIWAESAGTLGLVARTGDAAPGTGPGVVFSSFVNFPVINNAGDIAFWGRVSGTGVDETNDFGIWATDADGLLQLIAREGDLFDVNDDPLIEDLRMISTVALITGSGGGDGLRTSLNDNRELAFVLSFTDESQGGFVATIPEPSSLASMAVCGVALLRRRRA